MQCERAEEFFSDYLERTLDRPMTVALESHLAACGLCRDGIEALQTTFFALDAVPEVEPPRDGAWQVMSQIRQLRAEQVEAERRKAPSFLEWLRTLNPLSVGMGASLATLVIGGTLVVGGLSHTQLTIFGVPAPTRTAAPAPGADTPSVVLSYGERTATVQQVDMQVTPMVDLPNGRIEVMGGGLPMTYVVNGSLKGGEPVAIRLQLPMGAEAQTLRVVTQSPASGKKYQHLVVVPLAPRRADRVSLSFYEQPLEEGLRRLAPYLGRPVVVDGASEGTVTLQAEEQPSKRCLEELAEQVGATVQENGVYRLVPQQ